MGIFTRVRDIISSNINAMLDKAEDPEKLVKLMIREMEDTLVEVKAACAGAMATKKRIERELEEAKSRAAEWASKAELAVSKVRDDLAREALLEKRRYADRVKVFEKELTECARLVEQYQADIIELEEKLESARERQRILVQRHVRAKQRKRAQLDIRKADTTEALMRFESFERRIERMESEADLVNFGRKPSLEEEIAQLSGDEELEKELEVLKAKKQTS